MPSKAMISRSDSHDPNARPFTLSPLAWEDLTDEPVYTLTAIGRAEIPPEMPAVTPEVMRFLARFTAARQAREKARGDDLPAAIQAEDQAALKLAWSLERAVGSGS